MFLREINFWKDQFSPISQILRNVLFLASRKYAHEKNNLHEIGAGKEGLNYEYTLTDEMNNQYKMIKKIHSVTIMHKKKQLKNFYPPTLRVPNRS